MIVEQKIDDVHTEDGDFDTQHHDWSPLGQGHQELGWSWLVERHQADKWRRSEIINNVVTMTEGDELVDASHLLDNVLNILHYSKAVKYNSCCFKM